MRLLKHGSNGGVLLVHAEESLSFRGSHAFSPVASPVQRKGSSYVAVKRRRWGRRDARVGLKVVKEPLSLPALERLVGEFAGDGANLPYSLGQRAW
jgi:hypothetical protein